jgi:hypothetical protein
MFAGLSLTALLLASCDDAKNFLDPTGRAYGKAPDSSKKTPSAAAKQEKAKPAASVAAETPPTSTARRPPPPTQREAPPLSNQSAMEQAGEMLLANGSGWIPFRKGRAVWRGRNLTLWNEHEAPWGMAIVDLDQDGAEDAVFAVRSASRSDTTWSLAVLTDHAGKLQCLQNIAIPGVAGVVSLEATQGGVLVSSADGETRLFGWVGGQLTGN